MFYIVTESRHDLIRVHLSGMIGLSEVADVASAVERAVETLGLRADGYVLLVDMAECDIDAPSVQSAFLALIDEARYPARRVAVVWSGPLIRLINRRSIDGNPDAFVFAWRQEAEDWLVEGLHAPGAPRARGPLDTIFL